MGFWDLVEKITEQTTGKVADGLDRATRAGAEDLDRTAIQGKGISIWAAAPPPPKASSDVNWWGEPTSGAKKERSIWDAPGDTPDEKTGSTFSWW